MTLKQGSDHGKRSVAYVHRLAESAEARDDGTLAIDLQAHENLGFFYGSTAIVSVERTGARLHGHLPAAGVSDFLGSFLPTDVWQIVTARI